MKREDKKKQESFMLNTCLSGMIRIEKDGVIFQVYPSAGLIRVFGESIKEYKGTPADAVSCLNFLYGFEKFEFTKASISKGFKIFTKLTK